MRPGAAAVYNIKVVVTDSKGSIAESYSDVAVNPTELKNTSTVSDEISLGEFINISASASGGTEPYTYSYYYKKSSSNSWTAKFKDSALPSVTVKPGSVTNYDIKVIVKDDENNTAEKTFSVKVNPAPLVNTSTVSESITLGESIEIKGSAAGGTAPYKYEYFFKQETKTEWSKKNVDNTTSATTVKPGSAVPYNIKVVVTDSDGKTAEKTYSVKVNPAPLVNTSTVSESITLGESIEIKGSAAGGTAPYKYEYFFKQETKTEWSKKNVDNTTAATTVKPGSAVPYNVKVVVTDLAGKTAEKIFSVEVKAKPEPLVNTSTVSNTITLGENIEIIGSAAGGTAPYTYEYYFKQVKNDVWSKKNVSNTTTSTTIKPGSAVPYNIKVVVKDSKGETAERIYHVNVNEPEEEEVYYTYYFIAPDNYFKTEAGAANDKVGIYWWEPEEVKIWPGVEAVKAPEIGENVYKYVGISSEAAHIIFNEFYIGGQQTIDINTEGYHGDCPYDASIETDNFDGWIYVMNNDDIIEHPKFTGVMTTNGAWFKLDQYKDYKEYYGSYDFAKK